MSDILKITSAVTPKNYTLSTKPLAQSDAVFDLSDLSKIAKANDRAAEFRQSDNTFAGDKSQALLDIQLNIPKSPSFSSSLLKDLLGDDFINQIAQSGSPDIINEFNEFAKNIFLSSDTVLKDLISQQAGSTSFNGELFNVLREIFNQTKSEELKNAIAGFLKTTFSLQSQDEVLKSLSNNFKFLSESFSPSRSLSEQLNTISELLQTKDAGQNFSKIRNEAIKLLDLASNSLIATDKAKNMILLVKYNFSRFNDNPFQLEESFKSMLSYIKNENLKELLSSNFEKFIQGSNIPNVSKAALLSESDSFIDLDGTTYSLAEKATEMVKQLNIEQFNSDIETLSQQFAKMVETSGNLSAESGTNSLRDILKLVLPQDSIQDFSKILDAFKDTKDLNTLINRLSYILNSIENVDVKTALAKAMNPILTELSKSDQIIYRPPTSMENLADFLTKSLNNQNIAHLGIVDPHALVQSMLTAPGVFTPLLHYLLPVQIEDLRAFGELWVDNKAGDDSSDTDNNSNHIFLNIDIENIGLFELEIFSTDNDINVSLFCPKDLVKQFSFIKNKIETIAIQSGYSLKKARVEPLVKVRSLVEIFPRIAERRAGLNVKI